MSSASSVEEVTTGLPFRTRTRNSPEAVIIRIAEAMPDAGALD